jgi:hypothetical protein
MFQKQFVIGIDQVPVQKKSADKMGANELQKNYTLKDAFTLGNTYTAVLRETACKCQSQDI